MISNPTPAQLALLDNYVVMQRSIVSQFAKIMALMNALDQGWKANVSAIVGTPTGVAVNDSSNLTGKQQLTDTQVASMTTSIEAVLASYYTPTVQQVMVLFCGPGNMV